MPACSHPPSAPVVRPRLEGDLRACVQILEAVHRADAYPTHWPDDPEAVADPTWAARCVGGRGRRGDRGSRRAACPPSNPAEITRLSRRCSGSGVSESRRALLAAARGNAADRGLQPVIEVVDTNRAAVALYEREGWKLITSEPWADARAEPGILLLRFAGPRELLSARATSARELRRPEDRDCERSPIVRARPTGRGGTTPPRGIAPSSAALVVEAVEVVGEPDRVGRKESLRPAALGRLAHDLREVRQPLDLAPFSSAASVAPRAGRPDLRPRRCAESRQSGRAPYWT